MKSQKAMDGESLINVSEAARISRRNISAVNAAVTQGRLVREFNETGAALFRPSNVLAWADLDARDGYIEGQAADLEARNRNKLKEEENRLRCAREAEAAVREIRQKEALRRRVQEDPGALAEQLLLLQSQVAELCTAVRGMKQKT